MSKITNNGLNRSGTGCFIVVSCTHMATVGVEELIVLKRKRTLVIQSAYSQGSSLCGCGGKAAGREMGAWVGLVLPIEFVV